MKLKTLNDIENSYVEIRPIRRVSDVLDYVKNVAIKWIKHDIKRDNCIIPRTRTWMRRLDITEEDLDAKEDQSETEDRE